MDAERALEELCKIYWFPLYAWCRSHGHSPVDSEDLVQSFFVKALEKQLFPCADPPRGKLRSFLLTAFQNHVRDERQKAVAARRGGGAVLFIDPAEAEACYSVSLIEGERPEHTYDRQWALTVLDQAMGILSHEACARGKSTAFAAMRDFLTHEGDMTSYSEAARTLGISPGAFKVAVHRLRCRFREVLRAVIRDTQPDEANVEEEIAYLASILRVA